MYNYQPKYILDPLYGVFHFPNFVWDMLHIPEMQRLRELRLCNINSLCFTGSANINRYEHSIGTCYLAILCLEENYKSLPEKEKQLFILAALFHDVYNAAFGHSLEYIEGKAPENLFYSAVTGKTNESKSETYKPIFFGFYEEIYNALKNILKLSDGEIEKIAKYIRGEDELGVLISGSIDLDNIDNVFRLAYHMGLVGKTESPILLAKNIYSINNLLTYKCNDYALIYEWIDLRKRLYKFLLLNPEEFSAKYMLTEAIEISKEKDYMPFSWYDTDFQLLERLLNGTSETKKIIGNLMNGRLYTCIAIYSTTKLAKYEDFLYYKTRSIIESGVSSLLKPESLKKIENFTLTEQKIIKGIKGISYDLNNKILKVTTELKTEVYANLVKNELAEHKSVIELMFKEAKEKQNLYKLKSGIKTLNIGLHPILDKNKTERKVILKSSESEEIKLGESSNDLHIGVFIKNSEFYSSNIDQYPNIVNIKKEIKNYLEKYLDDSILKEITLYEERIYDKS